MVDKTNKESFEDLLKKRKDDDEDGDQNFIKFDGKPSESQEKRSQVFNSFKQVLKNALKKLEGVLPESNQQRNLDRETGGLEAEKDPEISEKDAWDDRSAQISQMTEDGQDLNNASKSTRERSFIHRKKQELKHRKKNREIAEEGAGYVAQLNQMRKARLDKTNINDGQSNGGGMSR